METRQLIICRGIQGSGKSTWAKQWCHEDPEHRIRFNNDDIRNMLGDYWVPNREKVVTATYNTVLAYGMEKGYNIVVDNMNLNPKTCVELEKTVKDFNEIGHFSADTGMVAVFLLDEVLKYNPDFDYHINREWTTTLIKDFDGEVNYYVDSEDDACIIGVGNINFFTSQVGI